MKVTISVCVLLPLATLFYRSLIFRSGQTCASEKLIPDCSGFGIRLADASCNHVDPGCDKFVTIFRRNWPKSAVVLAMAGGYNL